MKKTMFFLCLLFAGVSVHAVNLKPKKIASLSFSEESRASLLDLKHFFDKARMVSLQKYLSGNEASSACHPAVTDVYRIARFEPDVEATLAAVIEQAGVSSVADLCLTEERIAEIIISYRANKKLFPSKGTSILPFRGNDGNIRLLSVERDNGRILLDFTEIQIEGRIPPSMLVANILVAGKKE